MHAILRGILSLAAAALLLAGCQSTPRMTGAGPGFTPAAASAPLAYVDAEMVSDPRYAAIVVDARSGRVLHEDKPDALRHPASLAKMMTLYILFQEVESGRLSPDTPLPVSANAASQPPSRLGLDAGETIAVRDAASALAVRSANDVAIVVAEAIAGSEEAFAHRMTATARQLGMRRTIFRNASGLPDDAQVTTARDMVQLARALQTHFPQHYPLFAQQSFTYAGREHGSTNRLLRTLPGMDGIKTGYIRASGYNLAASIRRGNRHILVIVFGGPSGKARNAHVAALTEAYLPERSFSLAFQ